jgi:hypothetical protein
VEGPEETGLEFGETFGLIARAAKCDVIFNGLFLL